MRRRDLTILLGGATLLTLPLVTKAQQATASHHIGILAQDLQPGLLDNFRAGLRDFGYVEGKNITIEVRDAAGHNDRLPELIADLLRLKVEVILAVNTPAAKAAKKATATVPIIIMRVADPVKSGLIATLAHPGGNVTGLAFLPEVVTAKAFEMLRETLPKVVRIGTLYRSDNPGALITAEETERLGAQLGLKFLRLPVSDPNEFAGAFAKAAEARIEAVLVVADGALTKHRREIVDLAFRHSLPVISSYRDFAEAAGLFGSGPDLPTMYRRGAYFVDRILKGTRPADLPVEQPTKFALVVNLKTAKALGLTIPSIVMLQADELIE
jgi:putative ABC transport system substrate-binding protein